jgi:hypothetical protein
MRDSGLGDNVYGRGRAAWRRLKSNKNWNWRDWIIVGDSMMKARTEAFEEAGTNKAVGSRYNQAFGRILRNERLDGIDSATRNHLFQVMDNLPAIEAWRQPLAQNLKERLNHPLSVLRRWKASQAVPKQRKSARQDEHNDQLLLELEDKQRKIERLESHVERLEGRLAAQPKDQQGESPPSLMEILQHAYDAANVQSSWAELSALKQRRLKKELIKMRSALYSLIDLAEPAKTDAKQHSKPAQKSGHDELDMTALVERINLASTPSK